MIIRRIAPAARALLLFTACAAATAGCDVGARLTGAYRGPVPAQNAITDEVAVIRSIQSGPQVIRFVADRVRYPDTGTPHDVNRVIIVGTTPSNLEEVAALGLAVGDRVTLSTNFAYIGDAAEMNEVPDWPGHDFHEYPIAVHVLTSVKRTAP